METEMRNNGELINPRHTGPAVVLLGHPGGIVGSEKSPLRRGTGAFREGLSSTLVWHEASKPRNGDPPPTPAVIFRATRQDVDPMVPLLQEALLLVVGKLPQPLTQLAGEKSGVVISGRGQRWLLLGCR